MWPYSGVYSQPKPLKAWIKNKPAHFSHFSPFAHFELEQWHEEDSMPLHKSVVRKSLLRKPQLRKSPVRTRALLSANRANALLSTGPRSSRGKHSIALNALRHGGRARSGICWI